MLYKIINKKRIPAKITHIIWDIDGTITQGDIPDNGVCQGIITLGSKGVDQSFITGRDSKWLEKKFILFLSQFKGFQKIVKKLHFYPELCLMNFDPVSKRCQITNSVRGHAILNPKVRKKIANLFYQARNLESYKGKTKIGHFVGGDAEGNLFLFPRKPNAEFPWFIWSDVKEIICTAEVIRNPDTTLNQKMAEKINESAEKIVDILKKWGLEKLIKVSPVSTALNLVPIIDGFTIDKDVAAGIAVYNLDQKSKMNFSQICNQTIAIGDGLADLKFATPVLAQIPVFFVGPKKEFIPTATQENQIAVVGKGALEEGEATGPMVTREILQLIDNES